MRRLGAVRPDLIPLLLAALLAAGCGSGGNDARPEPSPRQGSVAEADRRPEVSIVRMADGTPVAFPFIQIEPEWPRWTRETIQPFLRDLRQLPELRTRLDERELQLLDSVELEFVDNPRIKWEASMQAGRPTITISHGAGYFIHAFATAVMFTQHHQNPGFINLLLLSEAEAARSGRRWYDPEPYILYLGGFEDAVAPGGPNIHDPVFARMQLQAYTPALLHELCHLFLSHQTQDGVAAVFRLTGEDRLQLLRSRELAADRCAADHAFAIGANPHVGLAIVLGASLVEDPATASHPPSLERVALHEAIGREHMRRIVASGSMSAERLPQYRELMELFASTFRSIAEQAERRRIAEREARWE